MISVCFWDRHAPNNSWIDRAVGLEIELYQRHYLTHCCIRVNDAVLTHGRGQESRWVQADALYEYHRPATELRISDDSHELIDLVHFQGLVYQPWKAWINQWIQHRVPRLPWRIPHVNCAQLVSMVLTDQGHPTNCHTPATLYTELLHEGRLPVHR